MPGRDVDIRAAVQQVCRRYPEFGELGKMYRVDPPKAVVDAAVGVSQSEAGIIAGLVEYDRTEKERADLVEPGCILDTRWCRR